MKRNKLAQIAIVIVVIAVYWLQEREASIPPGQDLERTSSSVIDSAFAKRQSDVLVTTDARVEKILADDNDGSRHQRFIVELDSGLTVLVAHNIDLAPRVANLRTGTRIKIKGEYEWNDRGGVIHWTHRDPRGNHAHGYLEYSGKRYE